ncbi:hypothetical protein BT63DRAFT_232748 [Microthyrium microscopicum]|uniref:SRR1-like domain-containing protein n=1 Tax=Microthyrium microscopicum TaxID=703497 RepID=A0A6A6UF42_9PEZI|nr:hypothetical protein BT63DRAFT_232748 [Microthyrium microscopicum]
MSRTKSSPKASTKPKANREIQNLQRLLDESIVLYHQSSLSKTIFSTLRYKQRTPINNVISLGLGSLTSQDQSRRIKQLTIFLAISEELESLSKTSIKLYAQDPTFTKIDEAFLQSLGINILRTPSPSMLGEAEHYISEKSLVYSPFLTIQAYQSLFNSSPMGMLIGDDFNALNLKFSKFTEDYEDVDRLVRHELVKYQRRSLVQDSKVDPSFWDKEDKMFPMALYRREARISSSQRPIHPVRQGSGYGLEKTISARL